MAHQRYIVNQIEQAGGNVWYGEDSDKPPGPAALRWLLGDDVYSEVREVNFSPMRVSACSVDPQLVHALPELKSLVLSAAN